MVVWSLRPSVLCCAPGVGEDRARSYVKGIAQTTRSSLGEGLCLAFAKDGDLFLYTT